MMCFSRTSFARDWRNRNRIFFQFSSRKMKQIGSGQWIWFVVSLFYFRWCIRYVFCGFFALDIEKWEKRLLISRNYRRSFIHVIFRFHLFYYSRCFVDFSLNFFSLFYVWEEKTKLKLLMFDWNAMLWNLKNDFYAKCANRH